MIRNGCPPKAEHRTPSCTVTFLPSGVRTAVRQGSTILEAARQAGVYVSSICGGDGLCGKCKVVVQSGEVQAQPTDLLSRDEIRRNVVLACLTRVRGDVVVTVTPEHALQTDRILLDADAHRFSRLPTERASAAGPGSAQVFAADPLVRKLYLELPPPTVEDNLGDHERLYAAIRKEIEAPVMQTGYRVIRRLTAAVRQADWNVTAIVGRRGGTVEVIQVEPGDTRGRNLGVVVDVGTTTVVAHLVDLCTAATLDAEATYNGQMQYGEDYIRRIMYAEQNDAFGVMQETIVRDINGLIETLAERNDVALPDIWAVICSGNTAMIHFLLRLDPTNIRRAPYVPTANVIPPVRAAEVGVKINARGLLFCLPSVAAYIGSDITAGVLATGLYAGEKTRLFVDIGTNGEVVLGNREWMVCASASAGPAFEGSGVRHGMRAAAGAIEKFTFRDGRAQFRTIGEGPVRGICGSGLLDVLAELFRAGVLSRSAKLDADRANGRVREGEEGLEFVVAAGEETASGRDVVLTQPDIDNLIRSKAGVYAAIAILMESVEVSPADLDAIYLAGGFGNYLDVGKAVTIGMLPDVPPDRIVFVGNTSVTGAKMCLLSVEALRTVEEIASQMTYFDLLTNARYMDEFVKANFLPHTDLERFRSVTAGGSGE